MTLTATQYDLVNFIEQEWLLNGTVPTKEYVLNKRICSGTVYDAAYRDAEFREALLVRGISLATDSGESGAGLRSGLTAEQLAVANVLLDRFDNRSRKKKLMDMGVSTQTLNGWMRDPAFRDYYTKRAEGIFGDLQPEVNLALADNIDKGDLGSMKLYMEMTGRWSSKTVGELNVEFLIMKIIEAIQRHVSDPATLTALADEIKAITGPAAPAKAIAPVVPYDIDMAL